MAVQRSMTTPTPPSTATRAASQLTTPSWSHRQPAPTATASSAWGRHSSGAPEHVHDVDGAGLGNRFDDRPERRQAEHIPDVRIDGHALVAMVDEVAHHPERGTPRIG